jgi:DNA (cytosine-5)-methyltransferase 1
MSSPTERKSTGATASRASTLLAPGLTAEHIAEIEAALAAADSDWRPTGCRTGITFTDVFCGFGGSSIGLENAGLELLLGANHRDKAIATHALNFPDADHLIADVSNYDMRRLPASDVLWASPICTELSPAGGRRRRATQLSLLEPAAHVPTAALDRTRATFWDVVRATEAQRYKIVAIENVVEASEWELFDIWLAAMDKLGYNHQFISVSSAHIGDDTNPHAPQWRDRLYIRVHRAVPADARCPSAPAGVVPAVRRGQPGRPIMEAPGSPQDW